MGNHVVEIERLSCAIGGKRVLRDISFAVADGEYLSIVGPNGAGKTTLLKCIARILKCRTATAKVCGKSLESYSQKELARRVSYVPQAAGSIPPFSVYEFLLMARYPYLSPFSSVSESDRDAVNEALRQTGTEPFSDRALDTLSGGERQKVFIAAAFAQGAGIILLDEPATFLDPGHASDIYRLLLNANSKRGVTIISVTHDINNAALTSGRILALKKGEIAFCGSPDAFMDNEVLRFVYDKSFLFMEHPLTGKTIVAPEATV